ncbi:MAG TPA: RodZ domain-containing protein [Thermomicrobiaceae bacterium]|nr:RodZ domain-containing protein [Thermomicrobiaceae bacterium]
MTPEFGDLLRHARAEKGVTLREAERATRISHYQLRALEREEFSELPALTYSRGLVRRYASYLGLDPVDVLARFEEAHGQRSGGFRVVPAVKPLHTPSNWAPNFAIIAFMVVMSAVIFAWWYSAYFAPPDQLPTPTTSAVARSTPTETYAAGGGIVLATPTPTSLPTAAATPTVAGATEPKPTPTPTAHNFTVTATHQVWVQVTLDGKTVLSTTLPAGASRTFSGQELHVKSGDAAMVQIAVDGIDQGALGTSWNTDKTYPVSAP